MKHCLPDAAVKILLITVLILSQTFFNLTGYAYVTVQLEDPSANQPATAPSENPEPSVPQATPDPADSLAPPHPLSPADRQDEPRTPAAGIQTGEISSGETPRTPASPGTATVTSEAASPVSTIGYAPIHHLTKTLTMEPEDQNWLTIQEIIKPISELPYIDGTDHYAYSGFMCIDYVQLSQILLYALNNIVSANVTVTWTDSLGVTTSHELLIVKLGKGTFGLVDITSSSTIIGTWTIPTNVGPTSLLFLLQEYNEGLDNLIIDYLHNQIDPEITDFDWKEGFDATNGGAYAGRTNPIWQGASDYSSNFFITYGMDPNVIYELYSGGIPNWTVNDDYLYYFLTDPSIYAQNYPTSILPSEGSSGMRPGL